MEIRSEAEYYREEADYWKALATQRGAQMQVLHEAIIEAYSYEVEGPLHDVIAKAAYWFDADGVPVRSIVSA